MLTALCLIATTITAAPANTRPNAPSKASGASASVRAKLDEVAKRTAAKDWQGAAAAARQLEALVASQAPLEVVDMQVLAAPADGLGIYAPLADGTVRDGELFLYAQVRHHGLREVHGWHELHLVSDLLVFDEQGNELARDEGFGESRFTARVPHRDTFVAIALRTRGLPSGKFKVRLVLHDRVGGKSAQAEAIFQVP